MKHFEEILSEGADPGMQNLPNGNTSFAQKVPYIAKWNA